MMPGCPSTPEASCSNANGGQNVCRQRATVNTMSAFAKAVALMVGANAAVGQGVEVGTGIGVGTVRVGLATIGGAVGLDDWATPHPARTPAVRTIMTLLIALCLNVQPPIAGHRNPSQAPASAPTHREPTARWSESCRSVGATYASRCSVNRAVAHRPAGRKGAAPSGGSRTAAHFDGVRHAQDRLRQFHRLPDFLHSLL